MTLVSGKNTGSRKEGARIGELLNEFSLQIGRSPQPATFKCFETAMRPRQPGIADLSATATERPMIEPAQCQSMLEVRAGVDVLDEQLVTLLAKRFRFMDAAARIKPVRSQVRDEQRKAAVLEHVRSTAAAAGAPADLIVAIYDQLIEASIAYELERFDER